MQHPTYVWVDPSYAEVPLAKLAREYDVFLRGRTNPVSPDTRSKYKKSLGAFLRSLDRAGDPPVLGSLTSASVTRWVAEQRAAGLSEDGIAGRLSALKVFSNAYVHRHLELTSVDLLRKVSRITPPERDVEILTADELEQVLDAFDRGTYEDRRDRTFTAVLIATGARLREIRDLRVQDFDPVTGDLEILGKGDRPRLARLSERPLKLLRAYLKERPKGSAHLWVTREGQPLGEWGVRSIFRRLKGRSGIDRLHPHLFRHTFGHHAIEAGAERALVMDMMGHTTDVMSRHYTRAARRRTAARAMTSYSPI